MQVYLEAAAAKRKFVSSPTVELPFSLVLLFLPGLLDLFQDIPAPVGRPVVVAAHVNYDLVARRVVGVLLMVVYRLVYRGEVPLLKGRQQSLSERVGRVVHRNDDIHFHVNGVDVERIRQRTATRSVLGRSPLRFFLAVQTSGEVWVRRILDREARMVDMQIMASLQNGTAFFASTTLLAIGGGLTLLRSTEEAMSVLATLPLGIRSSPALWEIKCV